MPTSNINTPPVLVGITNSSDYSPFGVQLDGRTISKDQYRYGFQNQEKDDELKGAGNSVNYKYRMHDPRVGRFFAVDPLESDYPWNSPYSFSENKVIAWREFEGAEALLTIITIQDDCSVHFEITMDYENENNAGVTLRNRIIFNGKELGTTIGGLGISIIEDQISSIGFVKENDKNSSEKLRVIFKDPTEAPIISQGAIMTITSKDMKPVSQIEGFSMEFTSYDPLDPIVFNNPFDLSVSEKSQVANLFSGSIPAFADQGTARLSLSLNDMGWQNTTEINVESQTFNGGAKLIGAKREEIVSKTFNIPIGSKVSVFTPLNPIPKGHEERTDIYESKGNLQYTVTPDICD